MEFNNRAIMPRLRKKYTKPKRLPEEMNNVIDNYYTELKNRTGLNISQQEAMRQMAKDIQRAFHKMKSTFIFIEKPKKDNKDEII